LRPENNSLAALNFSGSSLTAITSHFDRVKHPNNRWEMLGGDSRNGERWKVFIQ
jgi:hypothetical protein